jgi:hypothetical protein
MSIELQPFCMFLVSCVLVFIMSRQRWVVTGTAPARRYATKDLRSYALVVHCGGCMLDQQRMSARLADIAATGVPVTNYGLILAWFQSGAALRRVLEPWAAPAAAPTR